MLLEFKIKAGDAEERAVWASFPRVKEDPNEDNAAHQSPEAPRYAFFFLPRTCSCR